MRVMVTGGAGYIGSVVTEALLARGHRVVVYDNLYKGHRDAVPPGADFVLGDLLDGVTLHAAMREHEVNAVVHMAAASLVGESVTDPAKYYRQNVVAGLSLLDAMRALEVKHLVFSSTAALYGEPRKQPIEEADATFPTNPYGAAKLAFEQSLRWYDGAYGLKSVSLRYFNAAGATPRCGERHSPETHLIPLILQAAAGQREAVTVYGRDYPTRDGTCIRDYIHVIDLAEAHVLALEALASGRESGIFNLGCGGEGYSVQEVLDAAERVTGQRIRTLEGPRRPGDPAVLVASSERIRRELGWQAAHPGLEGIIESAWRFREGEAAQFATGQPG